MNFTTYVPITLTWYMHYLTKLCPVWPCSFWEQAIYIYVLKDYTDEQQWTKSEIKAAEYIVKIWKENRPKCQRVDSLYQT